MTADVLAVISTVSAAIAAVAAVVALYFAWKAVREGRATTEELKAIAQETASGTAAQKAVVDSMRDLIAGSKASAQLLHAVFLESQAAREVEALLAVRRALAEVASATHRVAAEHQPQFLFYVARQTLRAALAGIPDASKRLPVASSISTAYQVNEAQTDEKRGDDEVQDALDAARDRLSDASQQAAQASGAADLPLLEVNRR